MGFSGIDIRIQQNMLNTVAAFNAGLQTGQSAQPMPNPLSMMLGGTPLPVGPPQPLVNAPPPPSPPIGISPPQVTHNYLYAVLAYSPVGYWRMDAASGTTETD